MSEVPRLLKAEDVGEILGVNARAVLDLARAYVRGDSRGLPGVKVLREWRFTPEDVAAYITANRTAPRPGAQLATPVLPPGAIPEQRKTSRRRVSF